MATKFLRDLHFCLYNEAPDNAKSTFLLDELRDDIKLYADPKYDEYSVHEHFTEIAIYYGQEQRIAGFKEGLSMALQLGIAASQENEEPCGIFFAEDFEKKLHPVKEAGPGPAGCDVATGQQERREK